MFRLMVCFLVSLSFLVFISSSFFVCFGRFSSFILFISSSIQRITSSLVAKFLLSYLFFAFLFINLLGNVPLNLVPTIFYRVTLSLRLLFWLPLMVCVCYSDFRSFLSHMLPYGSPIGLMLFLPLVEIFSQVIRPFTLIVRLRTNLSSGHIMLYMFSYFTLLSSLLSPFIYLVLAALFVLELCISALQAYIFVSLLVLYANETV